MLKIMGEIVSLFSSILETYERGQKTYRKSLGVGLVRYSLQTIAYLLLGGIPGALVAIMAIVRSLFMYFKKFSGVVFYLWLFTSIALNLYFADKPSDLVPIIATVQFTFMARKQNALWLKYAQIINTVIWSLYHIAIRGYIYIAFDIVLLIVGIVRIKLGVSDD